MCKAKKALRIININGKIEKSYNIYIMGPFVQSFFILLDIKLKKGLTLYDILNFQFCLKIHDAYKFFMLYLILFDNI